ncbi:acyl-homoserine-lactone synthase [Pseudokordiimonas caeni]|uniref:acyl-homoserine-lactone synthase n=1 Tax=Pseudokordiimonas caeni TaxID=2997908 RepID=UPI0028119A24|nr:acyl-homoserine-lactone synthase [Pseudokordiimonas caeni]
MEVILIAPSLQHLFAAELDQAFALRHKVFNQQMGWGLPHRNGRESDVYDGHAWHLMAFDTPGRLAGYWRLTPSTHRNLTAEVFGDLFEGGAAPSDPYVWELSRYAIDSDQFAGRTQTMKKLMLAMGCGLMEFAILHGITELLSVQDDHIARHTSTLLGDPEWVSETRDYGATNATCYAYAPSLERLYALRVRYNLGTPVLSQYHLTMPTLQRAAA